MVNVPIDVLVEPPSVVSVIACPTVTVWLAVGVQLSIAAIALPLAIVIAPLVKAVEPSLDVIIASPPVIAALITLYILVIVPAIGVAT